MRRRGRKSAAQTPAPKSDRITGSKTNPKGSASSRKSAEKIKLSEQTITALKEKLSEFKKTSNKSITINDLKAVYRRGLGAYSSSHRPTITGGVPNTRNAWAMARVNKFLKKAKGEKVKAAYVQDDDLLEKGGNVFHLGGDMSKHLAPNGKPSKLTHEQWHLVRTPEFKAWFGDWENDPENSSKVVDDNGEPLVVYHGTTKGRFNVFSEKGSVGDLHGKAFYFTEKKNYAEWYAKLNIRNEEESYIFKVFLNVKKPYSYKLKFTKKELIKYVEEYSFKGDVDDVDDLINSYLKSYKEEDISYYLHNLVDTSELLESIGYDGLRYRWEWICYHPEQIKLADGTNTTFHGGNPDIRYDNGGEIDITKIGEDIYISKDLEKLPKNTLILEHRYFDKIKAGELGLFATKLGENDEGFGDKIAYISVGKNAKIKKINSTIGYLDEIGELEKTNNYIINKYSKYGFKSYFDLFDDMGSLDNPNDAYYEAQKKALSEMKKNGDDFEILEMLKEDDLTPHQYIITTLINSDIRYAKTGGDIINLENIVNTINDIQKVDTHYIEDSKLFIVFEDELMLYGQDMINHHLQEFADIIEPKATLKDGNSIIIKLIGKKMIQLPDVQASEEALSRVLETQGYKLQKNMETYKVGGIFTEAEVVSPEEKELYMMQKYQSKLSKGGMSQDIVCVNCGWSWNTGDSAESDKYICHKCGFDNTLFYEKMLKKPKNLNEISEMHNIPVDILQDELKKGIEHEMEHTNDVNVAKTIALHHIAETPNYYEKLESVKLGDGGTVKIHKPSLGQLARLFIFANEDYEYGTIVDVLDDYYQIEHMYFDVEGKIKKDAGMGLYERKDFIVVGDIVKLNDNKGLYKVIDIQPKVDQILLEDMKGNKTLASGLQLDSVVLDSQTETEPAKKKTLADYKRSWEMSKGGKIKDDAKSYIYGYIDNIFDYMLTGKFDWEDGMEYIEYDDVENLHNHYPGAFAVVDDEYGDEIFVYFYAPDFSSADEFKGMAKSYKQFNENLKKYQYLEAAQKYFTNIKIIDYKPHGISGDVLKIRFARKNPKQKPEEPKKKSLLDYKRSWEMAKGGMIKLELGKTGNLNDDAILIEKFQKQFIGKDLDVQVIGVKDAFRVKITDAKLDTFGSTTFLILTTDNKGEEQIPRSKFNDLIDGKVIMLKDSQNETYAIQLVYEEEEEKPKKTLSDYKRSWEMAEGGIVSPVAIGDIVRIYSEYKNEFPAPFGKVIGYSSLDEDASYELETFENINWEKYPAIATRKKFFKIGDKISVKFGSLLDADENFLTELVPEDQNFIVIDFAEYPHSTNLAYISTEDGNNFYYVDYENVIKPRIQTRERKSQKKTLADYKRSWEMENGGTIIRKVTRKGLDPKWGFLYAVGQSGENLIVVEDEKIEDWKQADPAERHYYYEDLIPENEIEYLEEQQQMAEGGVVVGKRHSESDENGTGEKFLVKSTGQVVELEGGEGVLCRESMSSDKKYEFMGKEMTGRQIASYLNHKYGGVEFAKGGTVAKKVCGCRAYYHGGEVPSATLNSLEGGEAVVTVKTMESKEKYNFQGTKMSPREILSKINADSGGKKFEEGGVIDLTQIKLENDIRMVKMLHFCQKILYNELN